MTRLVTTVSDEMRLTARRETDARMALARGLAEYLASLRWEWQGKPLKFERTFDAHSEPESIAAFPSAGVLLDGEGQYAENDSLSPSFERLEDGTLLLFPGEFACSLVVACWCVSPQQRTAITSMVESASSPVDWRNGFVLDLPHYHGLRGEYSLVSATDADDEDSARSRQRQVIFKFLARVPRCVVSGQVSTIDFSADVAVTAPEN